eukprot:TRINITY_DN3850_c0_g3_i1.p1 TRINITY_DN3850_c0_g3~~TRINITY_DN3850_c0_g3_i1.p1  ORF type:complete len:485 (-),score=191.66 TRINITY_DN3850_c0_g3_i1:281-1735(-)
MRNAQLLAGFFFAVFFISLYAVLSPDLPTFAIDDGELRAKIQLLSAENSRLKKLLKSKPLDNSVSSSADSTKSSEGTASSVNALELEKQQKFKDKLQEYTQIHKDIMSGVLPPRYVHCPVLNGWGNVIQEAISCFAFALVSKRAIIFDFRPVGFMPFLEFLNPDHTPIDAYNASILEKYRSVYIDPKSPDAKIYPRHVMVCHDYSKIQDECIGMQITYDFWAPNVWVNPTIDEEWAAILPRNYFQLCFNYLWRIKPELKQIVDEFKQKYFGKYTIGIQIRTPTPRLNKPEVVDHEGFPTPPILLYGQTAEQLTRQQTKAAYDDVRWFVATQNTSLVHILQRAYPNRIVYYNGTITTTFENNKAGQMVSFLHWWLLGEADDLITTEVSSYGTVAAARSGIDAIVCNHKKFCMRRLSPSPCQDTNWLDYQPEDCLIKTRKHPWQFLTAVDSSCGFEKLWIYNQPQMDSKNKNPPPWKIKGADVVWP